MQKYKKSQNHPLKLMNLKNKTTKQLSIVATIVTTTIISLYSAISISQTTKKDLSTIKKLPDNKEIVTDNNSELIKEVFDNVKENYVESKTEKQIAELAISGLLSSLDPHSAYLNQDSFKEMQVQTRGEFGGLGIELTTEMSLIKIISAIEDTPAFKEGLKSGDYISKIDGKTVIGMSIEDVISKLRGKPGTSVSLTILRRGEKSAIIKKIVRQIIKVKAVKSAKLGNVAYVKIITFSEQAFTGLLNELKKLKSQIGENKLAGLIIDLRNNPGGLLDQSVKIGELFLDKDQTIVSIKGRTAESEKIYKDQENQSIVPNLPIVVLINEGSASASEILAGALQDNKRAIVIGEKSFGKGSVQTVSQLNNDKGALQLTTALYYTPNNRSIQAFGITPDIQVTDAKIEKNKNYERSSEADLKGHIENESLKEMIENELKEVSKQQGKDNYNINDENLELYNSDYQLARALDAIRSLAVYQKTIQSCQISIPLTDNKNNKKDLEKIINKNEKKTEKIINNKKDGNKNKKSY